LQRTKIFEIVTCVHTNCCGYCRFRGGFRMQS